jgi:glycosyltransferase involved in cell wall biosynthesis
VAISVVIPCYNHGRFLPQAIESALGQSVGEPEIIVVDDGSSEDIGSVVRRYPGVRLVEQQNRGVADARNAGLSRATREFVVFLDADDKLLPDGLENGLKVLERRPHAGAAAGLCRVIGADGELRPFRQQPPITEDLYKSLLRRNFIWMPAQVIFRRSLLVDAGGFDPAVPAAADYELYLRLSRQKLLTAHRKVVADYRDHGGNMSGNGLLMLRSTLSVLERQWPHVRGSREYRRAYAEGHTFWRSFYGDRVVEAIRTGLRTHGSRAAALRSALSLGYYDPRAVARHLLRKARTLAAGGSRQVLQPGPEAAEGKGP